MAQQKKSWFHSIKQKEANIWITVSVVLLAIIVAGSLYALGDRLQGNQSFANLWDGRNCGSEGCVNPRNVGGDIRNNYGGFGGPKEGGSITVPVGSSGPGGPAEDPSLPTDDSAPKTPACSTKPICVDSKTLTQTEATTLRWSCPSGNLYGRVTNTSGVAISNSLSGSMAVGPFINTASGSTKTFKVYCSPTSQLGSPDAQVNIRIN